MSVEMAITDGATLPRLLVVGDVALFREGMLAALGRTNRFVLVGAWAITEAVAALREGEVDVVVLDTSRRRAFAQARQIRDAAPEVGIVAFGISGVDDALACAEAGVRAFVGEDGSIEAICEAAMLAVRGLSICPPDLTALLLERFSQISRDAERRVAERLTEREEEVAGLVAEGLSNKQIARTLAISPATVKNHVHAILGKFDLPRRSAIGPQLSGGRTYNPAASVPIVRV